MDTSYVIINECVHGSQSLYNALDLHGSSSNDLSLNLIADSIHELCMILLLKD